MARVVLFERQMQRFLRNPVSVRGAASVIVTTTGLIVIASGFLMRVLDHKEYPNVFIGMWWAIQTVTTVGYGDVTPKAVAGRIVAAFVMLEAIALVAIVTAAITSTFVARATHLQDATAEQEGEQREAEVERRFDDLAARLDRLETMLRGSPSGSRHPTEPDSAKPNQVHEFRVSGVSRETRESDSESESGSASGRRASTRRGSTPVVPGRVGPGRRGRPSSGRAGSPAAARA